jgi:hypothetical protein
MSGLRLSGTRWVSNPLVGQARADLFQRDRAVDNRRRLARLHELATLQCSATPHTCDQGASPTSLISLISLISLAHLAHRDSAKLLEHKNVAVSGLDWSHKDVCRGGLTITVDGTGSPTA